MKRLVDFPEELDDIIKKYAKAHGFPITQLILQVMWTWAKNVNSDKRS